MEGTSGHLIGFFYMFLLLLQGSLFLTRAHTNRWWTFTLEAMVAVHGTLVAVMTSGPDGAWPMFLFGFLGVFVITQMHGLGLSTTTRWLLTACYAGAAMIVYGLRGDLAGAANEAVIIPAIEYVLVGVLALLLWLPLRTATVLRRARATSPSGPQLDPVSDSELDPVSDSDPRFEAPPDSDPRSESPPDSEPESPSASPAEKTSVRPSTRRTS